MRVSSKLLSIVIIFTSVLFAQAQSMESLDNATDAYNRSDFDSAIQFFELTIAGGISNGEILYNLGNTYFEQGNVGKALLNYRRAMQYIPRDLDLNIQIARVRSLRTTLQTDTTQPLIFIEQASENVITITELSILTFAVWVMFWILVGIHRLKSVWKSTLRFSIAVVFTLMLCLTILLGARLYIYHRMPPAIVIADSSPVYSGPSISYFRQYDLFNASEIYIEGKQDEWLKFVTPDNQQGWIHADVVEQITLN